MSETQSTSASMNTRRISLLKIDLYLFTGADTIILAYKGLS